MHAFYFGILTENNFGKKIEAIFMPLILPLFLAFKFFYEIKNEI